MTKNGRGLAGARVDARASAAARQGDRPIYAVVTAASVSGEEGAYALRGLPLALVDFSATLDGYLPLRRRGVDASDGDVILQVKGAAALAGRVHDAEGRPIAGARVSLSRQSAGEGAGSHDVTNEEGWYEVGELSSGRTEVVARHPQWLAHRTQVDLSAGANRLDLQLDYGVEVSGRVTDADGAAVTGARVSLTPLTDSGRRIETASDDDGHFVLEPMTPGQFMVKALAEGLMAGELAEPLVVGPEGVSGVEIVLNRGATLTGRLLGLSENERGRRACRPSGPGAFAARVGWSRTAGIASKAWQQAAGTSAPRSATRAPRAE